MNAIVQFLVKHGYSLLFAAVFAHQLGFPVPGPLFLLAAGALAAPRKLGLAAALGLGLSATLLADWAWYEAGRQWGDRVLHLIHGLAPDPDAAEYRSRRNFARFGPRLLVLAKFVPGLDAVTPPLAGTSGTSRLRFLAFETAGAGLYSGAYAGLGYVFSHDLDRAAAYAARVGAVLAGLVVVGLSIYAAPKLARWCRFIREFRLARITPEELKKKLDAGDQVLLSICKAAGVVSGSAKVSPAPFASIRIGLNATQPTIEKRRNLSLAIARWSFTVMVRMSSQVPAWPWQCSVGDFTAFGRSGEGFGLGRSGASL
jgi:membrane protein DedA with SNARE-associated domain